jgi:hypothetical protein
MPLSQRSTVRPAVGQMAKVLRYGENSARREGPENLGPPSQTAAVFGKRRRQQQLGSRSCPVGHVVCAAARGAATGTRKSRPGPRPKILPGTHSARGQSL